MKIVKKVILLFEKLLLKARTLTKKLDFEP